MGADRPESWPVGADSRLPVRAGFGLPLAVTLPPARSKWQPGLHASRQARSHSLAREVAPQPINDHRNHARPLHSDKDETAQRGSFPQGRPQNSACLRRRQHRQGLPRSPPPPKRCPRGENLPCCTPSPPSPPFTSPPRGCWPGRRPGRSRRGPPRSQKRAARRTSATSCRAGAGQHGAGLSATREHRMQTPGCVTVQPAADMRPAAGSQGLGAGASPTARPQLPGCWSLPQQSGSNSGPLARTAGFYSIHKNSNV